MLSHLFPPSGDAARIDEVDTTKGDVAHTAPLGAGGT